MKWCLVALSLAFASIALADVVPPEPCPEPTTWQGAHDGSCVPCADGTVWQRRENNPEYGECVPESEARSSSGCSASGSGSAWGLLGLLMLARRRAAPTG